MEEKPRMFYWEAREHTHEYGSDWYWMLSIVSFALIVVSVILGNLLFGIVVLLGATIAAIFAARGARTFRYTVGPRGIRINDEFFPYSTIDTFYLDENAPGDTELLLKSKRFITPLIIVPIPADYLEDIDQLLNERLPEEYMEEPFFHKLLEFFGF